MIVLTQAAIFSKLAEWRPGATLDWVNANALAVGRHTDGVGVYHPEFVLNFRNQSGKYVEYSDLHFGCRFQFERSPDVAWVNERNRELRFTKLALAPDGLLLTTDLFGPDEALKMVTFEGTYVLFDHALVLIRAMATT